VVFADTFYWIAITNRRDKYHEAVKRFTVTLSPRAVVTTDEVLIEFLSWCSGDPMLRRTAGFAVGRLVNNPDIRIIPQSRSSFLEVLALYNARPIRATV
jgi:uncharacterized protein